MIKKVLTMAGAILVTLVLGVTIINSIALSKEQRCRAVDYDVKILNSCEQSTGCNYSYKELHDMVDRVAECAS